MSFMRNDNAVGQPQGGVGPSLASQGFTGIVALKPSTEGMENVAFNDFTMGVDTTALVQAENIYEVSDAFSRIVGKHGLKAGGEIHANQINTHPDVVFNGSFAFNGSETGLDFADFLLGVPSSYTQGQAQQFLQSQPLRGGVCAGQLEGDEPAHAELRRALGPHSAVGREVQSTADAGEGRAVAGVSGRAAGAGVSRRPGGARFAGSGAQQFCSAHRRGVVARLSTRRGCTS